MAKQSKDQTDQRLRIKKAGRERNTPLFPLGKKEIIW